MNAPKTINEFKSLLQNRQLFCSLTLIKQLEQLGITAAYYLNPSKLPDYICIQGNLYRPCYTGFRDIPYFSTDIFNTYFKNLETTKIPTIPSNSLVIVWDSNSKFFAIDTFISIFQNKYNCKGKLWDHAEIYTEETFRTHLVNL